MFVTEVLPPNVLLVPVQSSYSNEIAMKNRRWRPYGNAMHPAWVYRPWQPGEE